MRAAGRTPGFVSRVEVLSWRIQAKIEDLASELPPNAMARDYDHTVGGVSQRHEERK